MPEVPPPPRGLRFFAPGTAPAHRRRRLAFLVVWVLATLAMIWPVAAFFSGSKPFIVGLPLSLAWPVAWLLLVFAGLVYLYRTEPPDPT